jgi:hypothetical protein
MRRPNWKEVFDNAAEYAGGLGVPVATDFSASLRKRVVCGKYRMSLLDNVFQLLERLLGRQPERLSL